MASPATSPKVYKLNHTMLRVKDPRPSLEFYSSLGMTLLKKHSFPDAKFDIYFLGYDSPTAISHGRSVFDRQGLVELTHNYGTESDPDYRINDPGVKLNRGFASIVIGVDDVHAAMNRLRLQGHRFMEDSSILLDPDSYRVWIVGPGSPEGEVDGTAHPESMHAEHNLFGEELDFYAAEYFARRKAAIEVGIGETDVTTYRMNRTVLHVKDLEKSLGFYQEVMGMSARICTEPRKGGFSQYTLGYPGPDGWPESPLDSEGLLGLLWIHGTENKEEFRYHNGNDEPRGFGHICVSVDNLEAACRRFEDMGVNWKKRLRDGRMRNVAFILDPDGYWVEIIQNDSFKEDNT